MKVKSQGYIAPLAVLFFALAMGVFLVLLVDLGRAYVVRTQLRNVADGASLAALNAYTSYICQGTPSQCSDPQWVQPRRVQAAYNAAQAITDRNLVMGIRGPRPGGGLHLGGASGNGVVFGNYKEGRTPPFEEKNRWDPNANINAIKVAAKLGDYGNPLLRGIFTGLIGAPAAAGALSGEAVSAGTVSVRPYDIVILFDRSGSMRKANKFELSKEATRLFVAYIRDHQGNRTRDEDRDRIGIVDFEGYYDTTIALNAYSTADNRGYYRAVLNAVNDLQVKTGGGGTNHEVALARGLTMLQWWEKRNYQYRGKSRKRMLVFLTDGMASATYVTCSREQCQCPKLSEVPPPDRMNQSSWPPWSEKNTARCEDGGLCKERALAELNYSHKAGSGAQGIILHAVAISESLEQIDCSFIQMLPRNGGKWWCQTNPPDPRRIFLEIAASIMKQRLVK